MCEYYRSLKEVLNDYECYKVMATKPPYEKYPDNYIIDENRSVKWNREQVRLRNEQWERERDLLMINYKSRMESVLNELYEIIQHEVGYDISKDQAITIWNKAYGSGHSYGTYGILTELNNLIEFVQDILSKN